MMFHLFQAAIDDLLLAGFDHGDINVLAHENTVTSKLGRDYQSTAEFEDNTEAPRIGLCRRRRSATRKAP